MNALLEGSAYIRNIPSLDDADFARFNRFVELSYGLHFPEKRRVELERGVWQTYAASTCVSLGEFYELLNDLENGAVMRELLVNSLTITETHFFRDEAQFDALFFDVLPKMIEAKRNLRTLRIWSAGCSSGEEPYSIAIALRELIPDVDDWSITILGTDINTQALERARKGVYGDWAFRETRAHLLRERYFKIQGNRYELSPAIRRMVTFNRLNLVADVYPSFTTNTTFMDLILCRNVTIYFPEDVTRTIVERLFEAQLDGGWLVVGHSEPSLTTYQRYHVRNYPNAVLYQRDDSQPVDARLSFPSLMGNPSLTAQPSQKIIYKPVVPSKPAAAKPSEKAVSVKAIRTDSPPVQAPVNEDPLEQARELLSCGQSERARALLLDYTQKFPRHAAAISMLGKAYANLGNWSEAEKWCRECIALDKLSLEAYHTLALVLQHQGMIEPALEMMRKVVYIDRKHILGHFGLAELCHIHGQLSQALKSLDNARILLESSPDNSLIPGSGGITAGQLREVIIYRQQTWSAQSS